MSDIATYESRITAALDRIRQGIEKTAQDNTSATALVAARAENAELAAALRALEGQQADSGSNLAEQVASQQVQIAKLDAELQRLRQSNAQMREINTELRAAMTSGLAPELLDQAVAAEIEAMAAQRAAEAAEVEAVLAALKPLVEEAGHAAG